MIESPERVNPKEEDIQTSQSPDFDQIITNSFYEQVNEEEVSEEDEQSTPQKFTRSLQKEPLINSVDGKAEKLYDTRDWRIRVGSKGNHEKLRDKRKSGLSGE